MPYTAIEPLIGGLILLKFHAFNTNLITIEPLIGGLIPVQATYSDTPDRTYETIEPLIGGLKCSFAFLERGAVEELFTGVECGE